LGIWESELGFYAGNAQEAEKNRQASKPLFPVSRSGRRSEQCRHAGPGSERWRRRTERKAGEWREGEEEWRRRGEELKIKNAN
jgi:hypothetical protein